MSDDAIMALAAAIGALANAIGGVFSEEVHENASAIGAVAEAVNRNASAIYSNAEAMKKLTAFAEALDEIRKEASE